MENMATDPTIRRTLCVGVEEWMKNKNFMMEMRSSGKMKKFIQEQNEIGWNQVVQGRISQTIIKIQNDHLEANKHITKVHRDPNAWHYKIIIAQWSDTTTKWKIEV